MQLEKGQRGAANCGSQAEAPCPGLRVALPSTALHSLPGWSGGTRGPPALPLPEQPCLPLSPGKSRCQSPVSSCAWGWARHRQFPEFAQKWGESAAVSALAAWGLLGGQQISVVGLTGTAETPGRFPVSAGQDVTLGPLPESRLQPALRGPSKIEPLPSGPLVCLQTLPTHTHPPRTSLPRGSWLPQLICRPPTGNLRLQRPRGDAGESCFSVPGFEGGSHRLGGIGPVAETVATHATAARSCFLPLGLCSHGAFCLECP